MNKIYNIVWNATLGRYDVTSELSRGRKKTKLKKNSSNFPGIPGFKLKFLLSCIVSAFSADIALADDLMVPGMKPQDTSYTVITGPTTLIQGSGNGFADILKGDLGSYAMTVGQARDQGLITSGAEYVDLQSLMFGSKSQTVFYTDPTTQNVRTISVYDNAGIKEASIANSYLSYNYAYAVGVDGQYVDKSLFTIQSGASLDVNVGNPSSGNEWMNNSANQLFAMLKSSSSDTTTSAIFDVKNNAEINYNSKTVGYLGNLTNSSNHPAISFISGYKGEVVNKLGSFVINNLEDFKAYNLALQQGVADGLLTQQEYDAAFSAGYQSGTKSIYTDGNIPVDDAVRKNITRETVAFIKADGNGATVNISPDANIQLYYSDASVVRLTNGAILNNEGALGTFNSTPRGDYVVYATDSKVNNKGVIDAGTWQEMADFTKFGPYIRVSMGQHTGIAAFGDSQINNNGVINVSQRQDWSPATAIMTGDNTRVTNNGHINVAASPLPTGLNGSYYAQGVALQANSSLINNGEIYIGRMAQRDVNDVTADVSVTSPGTLGVNLINGGVFTNNAMGKIIIGSLAQAATAISAKALSQVRQNGVVELNGRNTAAGAALNIGIDVTGSTDVVNSGTINLNGINAIGLRVNAASQATNSGIINVNEGIDPVTKTANYGIWSEGNKAVATLSGDVLLGGNGAIGVHARNKGEVKLAGNGAVKFTGGENQIGYLIYGVGSKITNNSTGAQDVTSKGSTLYRIEGGANFDGSLLSGSTMSASGEGSTALLATGKSEDGKTLSQFNTGDMIINVTGDQANGVKVAGGGQGVVGPMTSINLSGVNSTAGIVDNRSTTITGGAGATGASLLTSLATLTDSATASSVTGYIARNGGTLIHKGEINFTSGQSTGVLVSGGTLDNRGTISVDGIAVDIQGANSTVENTGVVNATDGMAAYRVGNNATLTLTGNGSTNASGTAHGVMLDTGAKSLSVTDATIKVTGSGNAIENKAELSGITLKRTTLDVNAGAGVRTGASMAVTNSGDIEVNGTGIGILLANADGSDTTAKMDMFDSKDLVINVNSSSGSGIVTRTSGDVITGTSVNVLDANGGSALMVKGTTRNVEQYGMLTSISTTESVVNIDNGHVETVTNKGAILANSRQDRALDNLAGNGITFTNDNGGSIIGQVNLQAGNNTVNLKKGSTGNDFTSGAGTDIFNLIDVTPDDGALFTSLNGGAGFDTLNLENSVYTLTDINTLTGFEQVVLKNGSSLTEKGVLLALGDDRGDGADTAFSLDASSSLALQNTQDLAFNNHLSGTGTLRVELNDKHFSFTHNNAADRFKGTVDLNHAQFALQGLNTQALSDATLKASEGANVTVGNGEQTLGGLAFNGGNLDFGVVNPGFAQAPNHIHAVNKLDLSGRGSVQVELTQAINGNPLPANTLPLLEQDDSQIQLTLADTAGMVTGSAGNLELIDQNGDMISTSQQLDITQQGATVAKGTWDYRLTGGEKSDGLYINYGLKQVELLASGDNALVLAATKTGPASDLSARVTGSGDLHIDTGASNRVSLSNMDNDYRGATDVLSGTLALNNDGVLGNTAILNVAHGATVAMNGHTQKVGAVNSQSGSLLDLSAGSTLTITDTLRSAGDQNGGSIAGDTLTGSGTLIIDPSKVTVTGDNLTYRGDVLLQGGATALLNSAGGLGQSGVISLSGENDTLMFGQHTSADAPVSGILNKQLAGTGNVTLDDATDLTLKGDNRAFAGTFFINSDSTLRADNASSLGDAAINNVGLLSLNAEDDWTLANNVIGSGDLEKWGSGALIIDRDLSYSGTTALNEGSMIVGSRAGSNGKLSGAGTVNVAKNATLAGLGEISGMVNNGGTIAALNALTRSAGSAPSTLTLGGLNNSGVVTLAGSAVGNSLVVNGNYHGDRAKVIINSVLGDDDSLSDKLIVKGNTSGDTQLKVNNINGQGALTDKGIEVVSVGGQSLGQFTLAGRAVAGAWEYFLNKGEGADGNWYLQTNLDPVDPVEPVNPDDPVKPIDPDRPDAPTIRPEAGAYAANIAAANTLFVTTLRDRLGETHYVDALTGEKRVTSMWLRNIGGHNVSRDQTGQLKTQSNRYVLQMGGDIAQWENSEGSRTHLGVMAGYGNSQSHTRSQVSGYRADGQVHGYNLGIYGTWLENEHEHTGLYVDSWAQYGWFDNSVKGEALSAESYKSSGFTASVESGYTFKLGQFTGSQGSTNRVYIEPQAQAIWMGVQADDHREANGTQVKSKGDGNVMTRLGVRTFIKGHHKMDDSKQRDFQPFIEMNWIHNTKDFGVSMNNVSNSRVGAKNIAEIKTGVEGKMNNNLNVWGNVGVQIGDKGYSDAAAMVGFKYNF